jgi:ABC-type Zn uptake system ZnuABC Zn-binding protein ZnuA
MTKKSISLAAALLLTAAGARAAKMRVLTTTVYTASLAKTIGGDKVDVESLVPPGFNADNYSPRPQDLFKIHKAKVFMMIGLNLEDWARDLVSAANNPDLVEAELYHGITLLDKPAGSVDFSFGDIHPFGNPHFQTDPEAGRMLAKNIAEALGVADPADKELFAKNLADFEAKLTVAEKGWKAKLAPYKGTAILTYHESWDYFAAYFGFPIPVPPKTIEEKPGFVPSPRRIQEVIRLSKDKNVKLIVTEPYYDVSIAQSIADSLGVPMLNFDLYGIGANPKEKDYISMVDDVVDQVAQKLGGHAH